MGHRVALPGLAAILALGLVALVPAAALAECDGPAVSFRELAATGSPIVIGDVVDVDPAGTITDEVGRSSVFTLRIRQVLKGSAAGSIAIRDVRPGPCIGPIIARAGDRIAVAFDVKIIFWDGPVSAMAWVIGTPPDYPGIERITVAEAFGLLGLRPPDTATGAPGADALRPLELVAVISLLLVATAPARRRHGLGPTRHAD